MAQADIEPGAAEPQVVDRYHRLLEDPETARATHDHLVRAQRAAGLVLRGRPASALLRPRLVGEAEHARVCAAGSVLARAVRRLTPAALDPGGAADRDAADLVRQVLAPTAVEQSLAAMARPDEEPVPHGRFDGFLSGDALWFVEFNAHSPAGVVTQEQLARIYQDAPVMREFTREYPVHAVPTRRRMAQSLVDAWHRAGAPGGSPRVAVVDWADGRGWEFTSLVDELHGQGVPALVCSPDDLRHEAGYGLYTRDAAGSRQPVTVVLRRAVFNDLLSRYGPAVTGHPMVRAWAAGDCAVVNPFTSHLAHRKSVLALLTDPRATALLAADEAAAARAHIPWTRLVREGGTTTRDGREADLLDHARRHRGELVLKPDDDYGGAGVVCGWETTAQGWQDALAHALTRRHVVQERVPHRTAPYPALAGGRLRLARYGEGTDPYVYGSHSPGFVARVSGTSMFSVGGGAVPLPVFQYRTAPAGPDA